MEEHVFKQPPCWSGINNSSSLTGWFYSPAEQCAQFIQLPWSQNNLLLVIAGCSAEAAALRCTDGLRRKAAVAQLSQAMAQHAPWRAKLKSQRHPHKESGRPDTHQDRVNYSDNYCATEGTNGIYNVQLFLRREFLKWMKSNEI